MAKIDEKEYAIVLAIAAPSIPHFGIKRASKNNTIIKQAKLILKLYITFPSAENLVANIIFTEKKITPGRRSTKAL